jgi:hypothetical protein
MFFIALSKYLMLGSAKPPPNLRYPLHPLHLLYLLQVYSAIPNSLITAFKSRMRRERTRIIFKAISGVSSIASCHCFLVNSKQSDCSRVVAVAERG